MFDCDHPVHVWADEFKIEEVVTNYVSKRPESSGWGESYFYYNRRTGGRCQGDSEKYGAARSPRRTLPNLWTKFYKVDKARTRAYGGSGIGLSIVKAIIDSHHKECGVRNVEDGVAFWFTVDSKV